MYTFQNFLNEDFKTAASVKLISDYAAGEGLRVVDDDWNVLYPGTNVTGEFKEIKNERAKIWNKYKKSLLSKLGDLVKNSDTAHILKYDTQKKDWVLMKSIVVS